jgi:hypothetical protein
VVTSPLSTVSPTPEMAEATSCSSPGRSAADTRTVAVSESSTLMVTEEELHTHSVRAHGHEDPFVYQQPKQYSPDALNKTGGVCPGRLLELEETLGRGLRTHRHARCARVCHSACTGLVKGWSRLGCCVVCAVCADELALADHGAACVFGDEDLPSLGAGSDRI